MKQSKGIIRVLSEQTSLIIRVLSEQTNLIQPLSLSVLGLTFSFIVTVIITVNLQ